MDIEKESPIETELTEILEQFKGYLDEARDGAESGGEIFLILFDLYEELAAHEPEMMATISKHLNIDLSKLQSAEAKTIQGTDGTPGEGPIEVRMIEISKKEDSSTTNDNNFDNNIDNTENDIPKIYFIEYTYTDKSTVHSVGPWNPEWGEPPTPYK
ncbi:MAG: hypothetical protein M1338_03845 [Patescibacteria group bacterium]|nr:hypothetical protein [Patescibacteria group bacterium]